MNTLQSSLCGVMRCHVICFFLCAIALFPATLSAQQLPAEQQVVLESAYDTSAKTNELIIATAENPPEQDSTAEGSDPAGAATFSNVLFGDAATTEKIFGGRGGYFHPYFSVEEKYTDNLFNINIDQVEVFLTSVSTGAWFSLPRLDGVPIKLATHNAAIGGARLSLSEKKSFDRFQAYLAGDLNYRSYSDYTDLNNFAWRLEGLYQQNLPAGISFRFIDRFSRDQDTFDRGSFLPQDFTVDGDNTHVSSPPSLVRSYYSNLAHLSTIVDLSGRFSTQLDFTSFYLSYDKEENNWLNRMDTRYSASIAYKYSPKTSFFVEYDYAVVTYDTEQTNDGSSSFFYTGINWKGSEKTSLMVKGGYQSKKYDSDLSEKVGAFTAEARLNYKITDKTSIAANLYKALEESNSLTNNGVDTIAAGLHYEQRFNYRVLGRVDFSYEQNNYQGFTRTAINDTIDNRKDMLFSVRPAVEYTFRDWLRCDLAYTFENRSSDVDIYDFTTQTITLSMNIAF